MYDVADWNDSDTVHGHSQPEPDEIPPAAEGAEGDEQAVEPTSGEPNVKDPDELGGELHSQRQVGRTGSAHLGNHTIRNS